MSTTNSDKPKVDITSYSGKTITEYFNNLFHHIFDLRDGLDRKGTVENIKKNTVMQGANVWLLICSILVASLGLDLNSSAVIIGAMLISPLMSPILGIGLAIGIYDRKLLTKSLINYGIALFIALVSSIVYFLISPLGEATTEIMARTQPNLLDVAVAFFGGIAGIVATSRKDLLNAVPGVAIATALMPPVCVAGFGIANLDWEIFSGAIYLFFLNTVFVALATYLIVRLLRYPYKAYQTEKERRRNQFLIFFFVIVATIPSITKLFTLIQDASMDTKIVNTINSAFEGYDGDIKDISLKHNKETDIRSVNVYLYGTPNDSMAINATENISKTCPTCEPLSLKYSSVKLPDMNKFGSNIEQQFSTQLSTTTAKLEENFNAQIDSLQRKMQSFAIKDTLEIDTLFSIASLVDSTFMAEIDEFWFGELDQFDFEQKTEEKQKVALIGFKKSADKKIKTMIKGSLKERLSEQYNTNVQVKEW